MKRVFALLLAVLVSGSVMFVAACTYGGGSDDGQYKLGMGTAVTLSEVSSEEAKATVTTVAVITDAKGEIVDCVIDCGDFGISFDDVKANKSGTYLTKGELREDYGMKAYSDAQWEWYEQAEYFSNAVKGKNAKAVTNIGISANGTTDNSDILAGCTIAVSDFKAALVKAMGDTLAVEFESDSQPTLSLALINSDSISEAKDGEYPVSMNTNISAVASADGKVLGAIIDVVQASFAYDGEGAVSSASFGGTKREKLDSYGMKGNSGIGKEWYQQADAFCSYIAGLDADGISEMKLTEDKRPEDADLLAGCTVSVGDYQTVVLKALKAAE